MAKTLLVAAVTFSCLVAHGAGILAEHVVTNTEGKHQRVEVGQWVEDERGRSRFDIDDFTQIADPVEGMTWSANSKRGRYTTYPMVQHTPPMGSPLIYRPGSLNSHNSREISRVDLGSRSINGIQCEGTQVSVRVSSRSWVKQWELEAWHTEAYAFPFNVLFVIRSEGNESKTELRNIVQLTDAELAGVFEPPHNWKKSRLPLVRATASWTGVWPLTRAGTKDTTMVTPWPWPIGGQAQNR